MVTRASNFVFMREISSESELVVADWLLPCPQRTIRNKIKIIIKKTPRSSQGSKSLELKKKKVKEVTDLTKCKDLDLDLVRTFT